MQQASLCVYKYLCNHAFRALKTELRGGRGQMNQATPTSGLSSGMVGRIGRGGSGGRGRGLGVTVGRGGGVARGRGRGRGLVRAMVRGEEEEEEEEERSTSLQVAVLQDQFQVGMALIDGRGLS